MYQNTTFGSQCSKNELETKGASGYGSLSDAFEKAKEEYKNKRK